MTISQEQPIELYFWPTPNGWKASIMLEELGVPYNLHLVNIGKGDQFAPEFLAISPNNRMPAILDPEGPGGEPISVFESGAILQYLGRKFQKFYPDDERKRVETEEWLMWQMGGFGPMLGQNHHFRHYAPEEVPYAIERYSNETHRLYGVLNRRLEGRAFIAADEYTIADIATFGWAQRWQRQNIDLEEFPNVRDWRLRLEARDAVQRGLAVGADQQKTLVIEKDKAAQSVLFGQKAR
ncbi:glutathione S-transferase N-terminal domain-containing protein [uncultured Roseibium sp.]|uniref:glutathione S-transferase N-terminal domain-containing protein n=1 Tax=uncultured Roseibium sp. TaxID=1936171 RepID=UPI002604307C|nr:glutathione S-transferase N-terminal domain-containing protein [uncultured Roseibium sp.]